MLFTVYCAVIMVITIRAAKTTLFDLESVRVTLIVCPPTPILQHPPC